MEIKSQLASLPFPVSMAATIIIITFTATVTVSQDDSSDDFDQCKPFSCRGLNVSFSFPFSPSDGFASRPLGCGLPGYQIACDPSSGAAVLQLGGRLYRVKYVMPAQQPGDENLITVVDDLMVGDLGSGSCGSLQDLSIPAPSTAAVEPLNLPFFGFNLTLFKCSAAAAGLGDDVYLASFNCSDDDSVLYLSRKASRVSSPAPEAAPGGCGLVSVPVSSASLSLYMLVNGSVGDEPVLSDGLGLMGKDKSEERRRSVLVQVLGEGFPLQWGTSSACDNCRKSGGRCGYDFGSTNVVCLCRGGCHPSAPKNNSSKEWKLIVGVASGASCVVLAVILLTYKHKRKISPPSSNVKNAEQFIKDYRSTLLTNYSYSDIKKMASDFKHKLGEGGYGTVYKGKLKSDGRVIAVKLLNKSTSSSDDTMGHDFINEVTTIGTIHHANVIRLIGFCWDGSKRALLYEYMPNGSLGDLLSKDRNSLEPTSLLQIAIGVSHGIEYLHNGCSPRILHLDIKPQNVLLDQDFTPKISDFGLAKTYSRTQSAVSMTGARGTIGYAAPEIFMSSFGKASHKSDVYSYGMLVLEMVGMRKQEDPSSAASSEVYFPACIYDQITELEDKKLEGGQDIIMEEGRSISKKMVMVGLWCIQMNPRDRPSMTRVVEMLSGSVDAIEMPPEPCFAPPRLLCEQETRTRLHSQTS